MNLKELEDFIEESIIAAAISIELCEEDYNLLVEKSLCTRKIGRNLYYYSKKDGTRVLIKKPEVRVVQIKSQRFEHDDYLDYDDFIEKWRKAIRKLDIEWYIGGQPDPFKPAEYRPLEYKDIIEQRKNRKIGCIPKKLKRKDLR